MPGLSNRVVNFSSLDIESYLNEKMPRYERCLLETEKHNVSKVEHEIDAELLRALLLNSNNLLDILNVYEKSYGIVTDLVDLSKELLRLHLSGNEEEETLVDTELVEKFRQVLDNFSSDTSVFATKERYLVYFDILEEMHEGECILVFTNDILIIGRVQTGAKRYRFLNAYSYNIIQVSMENDTLQVKMETNTYTFRKDEDSIDEILKVYQELTYKYDEVEMESDKSNVDDELLEYLVYTEQYEHIEPHVYHCTSKIMFHDKEEMMRYLSVMAKFDNDVSSHVYPFLEERFEVGLMKINRVQTLNDLIEDIFRYFRRFFDEQDELLRELDGVGDVRRSGLILLIEKELKSCFKILEKRVFGRGSEVRCMESSLRLIEKNLRFCKCDFSYLMDYFLHKKDEYREKCLESAMEDITRILHETVAE